MKFINLVHEILSEAYSVGLVNKLIKKFTATNPEVTPDYMKEKISRFQDISANLENKDITTYSWDELIRTLQQNKPKRIKAGKIDKEQPDANLVYNENKLRIYRASTKNACVKYGNGYTFCISSRGEDNKYFDYRMEQGATPYFIFDDRFLNRDKDADDYWMWPQHLLVLMVYPDNADHKYSLSDADNTGEEYYDDPEDICEEFERLRDPFKKGIFKLAELEGEDLYLREKINIEHKYFMKMDNVSNKLYRYLMDREQMALDTLSPTAYDRVLSLAYHPNKAYVFYSPNSMYHDKVSTEIRKYIESDPIVKKGFQDMVNLKDKEIKEIKQLEMKLGM